MTGREKEVVLVDVRELIEYIDRCYYILLTQHNVKLMANMFYGCYWGVSWHGVLKDIVWYYIVHYREKR